MCKEEEIRKDAATSRSLKGAAARAGSRAQSDGFCWASALNPCCVLAWLSLVQDVTRVGFVLEEISTTAAQSSDNQVQEHRRTLVVFACSLGPAPHNLVFDVLRSAHPLPHLSGTADSALMPPSCPPLPNPLTPVPHLSGTADSALMPPSCASQWDRCLNESRQAWGERTRNPDHVHRRFYWLVLCQMINRASGSHTNSLDLMLLHVSRQPPLESPDAGWHPSLAKPSPFTAPRAPSCYRCPPGDPWCPHPPRPHCHHSTL